ncbi:hypothetical protein BC827DRAFT_247474 [Russula dissimulans]|nr:hypothetical protein BC827DRAFT_247474 [Russula dissimulans]
MRSNIINADSRRRQKAPMEHPEEDIRKVLKLFTMAASPEIQQAAVQKYFTTDASFRHPIFSVSPATNSREGVLGIYQWYRITSAHLELSVNKITYDAGNSTLFLDTSLVSRMRFSPFPPARISVLTRIILQEEAGRHYIASLEDFIHPADLCAMMIPPFAKPVSLFLRFGGFMCGLYARIVQSLFDVWRPRREKEN